MAHRQDVGEDPGVGDQLGAGVGREGRDRERDPGEVVEQLAVVVQADAAVEQVAAAGDAGRVDVPDRADHQVERQAELGAELGERPEDGERISSCSSGRRSIRCMALRIGVTARFGLAAPRHEVRRQADRAGPRPVADELLEQPADRLPQAGDSPARPRPSAAGAARSSRLVQLQHQVVGPQAGDVRRGVPALQRVVELVGQEDGLEPRAVQTSRSQASPSLRWSARS